MRCLLSFFVVVAVAVAGGAACARTSGPAAAVTASKAVATDESTCSSCHAQEAAEWDASLHHASFTDHDFQISYRAEPLPFCFRCHAPQAANPQDERGAALGVGCTSCHSVANEHGKTNTAVNTTTTSCSSCHEFSFPNKPTLMQSTVTEHRSSAFSDVSCASCHLPKRDADGHRDHRFDVSRNEAMLRQALTLQTQRTTSGVIVTLTTNGVGHAMPTGDLFRRLRVSVHALSADGSLIDEREALLGRHHDFNQPSPVPEQQQQDDRVVGEHRIAFEGGSLGSAKTIEVDVRYERVAQTSANVDRVFSSLIIAESSSP